MAKTQYRKTDGLKRFERIITHLIRDPEAVHGDKMDLNICVVGKDKGKSQVKKAAPLVEFLTGYDANRERGYNCIIEVAESDLMLYEKHLDAFADHLLCHIEATGDGDFATAKPEVQEFIDVLERRGVWRQPVAEMAELPFVYEGKGETVQ